jgi:predicted phage tail protein
MDLIVLVCVVLAALAAGVLAAYGISMAMFAAFQMHARQVRAEKTTVPASAASVVQS